MNWRGVKGKSAPQAVRRLSSHFQQRSSCYSPVRRLLWSFNGVLIADPWCGASGEARDIASVPGRGGFGSCARRRRVMVETHTGVPATLSAISTRAWLPQLLPFFLVILTLSSPCQCILTHATAIIPPSKCHQERRDPLIFRFTLLTLSPSLSASPSLFLLPNFESEIVVDARVCKLRTNSFC